MMPTTPALDLTQAAMRERMGSARMRSKPMSTVPLEFETGAVVLPTPALSPQVTLESALQVAQKLSLPVMGAEAELAFAGALMGFGPSNEEYLDSLAVIVNKVLRGANPADVPVQQPTKFELAMNLKVAKALGVNVPNSVLMRADGVVQ